jgi:hypothetical protein
LRALRDGRHPAAGRSELQPDPEKLKRVASGLAEMLLAYSLVEEQDVAEALGASSAPAPEAPVPYSAQPAPSAGGVRLSEHRPLSPTAPIFVVHGHHHGLLHEVVRVLERATSREVIVLHEQASAGRTILEKFEAHAATASYAVVLLTGDDVGGVVGGPTAPRGRQNVIFELGFSLERSGGTGWPCSWRPAWSSHPTLPGSSTSLSIRTARGSISLRAS